MAIAMEWGWQWDYYLDCWPAKWHLTLNGQNRLRAKREEAS